jgi:hypothetical protein
MAHFLIDAGLPRPTAALVIGNGHAATDVRDIGMATAHDSTIAAHAKAQQMIILTVDQDFGNILDYPPEDYHGIVVVQPPPRATRAAILKLIEQFLNGKDIIDQLPGRLAIVEPGRVRLRPAN